MPLTLSQAVEARRDEALAQLSTATGDASLCAVSRSGTPRPAMKYHEGAVAALTDVRRRLGESAEPADAAVGRVRERWEARRDQAAVSASPTWQAYLDGAVDALDGLPRAPEPEGAGPAAAAPTSADALSDVERLTRVPGPDRPLPANLALSSARPHRHWSRRRTAVTVVLAPVLLLLLVTEGGGWDPPRAPPWTFLVAATATGAAAILATYLHAPGGCRGSRGGLTPCAVVPVMTVLAAGWLLGAEPHAVPSALAALAAVTFGLAQRLTGAACSA
ncbi:hypothetical protein [Georgenia sp. H159]|uniref:hypothetical protein n=1 Tax=Georgenia sp. H159 TaxID=3076115 RepID=UPI002D78CA1A|nr:hypothetical protein [Georgenia sp. H159]